MTRKRITNASAVPEEVMLIEASTSAVRDEQSADDEALRDAWFDMLRRESGHG